MKGHTAIFTTAAGMLNELAALDSEIALRRRIKFYAKPDVLVYLMELSKVLLMN